MGEPHGLKPLISVVIPAYNVETFIESTLQSILAQDYPNIEVIVVDDASTDRTPEIVREVLSSRKCRWRVIEHASNKGVSSARNTGMLAADGQYIIFIDSDDLADAELLSSLYARSSASDADIAFCSFRMKDERTGVEKRYPLPLDHRRQFPADVLTEMYIFGKIHPSICTTLFKSHFLRETGLSFTEGCKTGEDTEFLEKALAMSLQTAFCPDYLYTYRHHADMTTQTSRATPEKKIEAATSSVDGQLRVARYLCENSASQHIRNIARYYMMPKFRLKMLNIQAWKGDKKGFMELFYSAETKNILRSSRRMFFKEPGLFLKALTVTLSPSLYFEVRKKMYRRL